jgi:hypothetical protein
MKTAMQIAIDMIDNAWSYNKERGHHSTCNTLSTLRKQLEQLRDTTEIEIMVDFAADYKSQYEPGNGSPRTFYHKRFNQ